VAQALDCGADDFINKPPSPPELYAKLRAAERMANLHRELVRLANRDPLTGVYNRRGFFDEAGKACLRAGEGSPLSAILFDIDHFKEVNDLYGHATGDAAIKSIAHEAAIVSDVVGRLGGDEFSVVLEGQSLAEAMQVASDLQRRFAAMRIKTADGLASLTCSLGVAEFVLSETIDHLINRADAALYRAKTEGRNCVARPPSRVWLAENPRLGRPIARNRPR
jgi:diguanylate cyclase (GGDEF)-like protein